MERNRTFVEVARDLGVGSPETVLWAMIMTAYVRGTSTRKVDDLVRALGCESGVSRSTVSPGFGGRGAPPWVALTLLASGGAGRDARHDTGCEKKIAACAGWPYRGRTTGGGRNVDDPVSKRTTRSRTSRSRRGACSQIASTSLSTR
jgi:hypothetical protein